MKLSLAIEHLLRMEAVQRHPTKELRVKVFSPGAAGGTPSVVVTGLDAGFDWDVGKVLISTDVPLARLTPDDVAAIHASVGAGQSWHAYQAYKKQATKIKALQASNEALQARVQELEAAAGVRVENKGVQGNE